MFVMSGRQIWDCFKKLMPYQAATAVKYQKDPNPKERNRIKIHMKDGTMAFFTMKDDHSYIYEKRF